MRARDALLVNYNRLIVLAIAAFICLAIFPMYGPSVNAVAPLIVPDLPVVPLWNIGGTVRLAVSQIPVNVTYYVWTQRPTDSSSQYTGFNFINAGNTASVPVQVTVSATDPAGTYAVSLSTSNSIDNQVAVAHFGVCGVDAKAYQRTNKMIVAGGGFAPSSTVSINLQVGSQGLTGFPTNVTAGPRGDFSYTYRVSPSVPTGAVTASVNGQAYDSHGSTSVMTGASIEPTTIAVRVTSQPNYVGGENKQRNHQLLYHLPRQFPGNHLHFEFDEDLRGERRGTERG